MGASPEGALEGVAMATLEKLDALVRLDALEPDVKRLARRWARDAPHAEDDLTQVARVSVWQLLRERPDAPPSHLMQEAKEAILRERKRGCSVDGRLNPTWQRAKTWTTVSLDDPYGRLDGTDDALASGPIRAHNLWESPVEGEALGHVLYEMLREILTPKEDALLALFLVGYWNKEAQKLLGLSKKEVRCARYALQRKVMALVDPDGVAPPSARSAAARRAALAMWGRRKPFFVSPGVQVLLTQLMEVISE